MQMSDDIRNVATGNAVVGSMIGKIVGDNVHVGGGVLERLLALQTETEAARAAGTLTPAAAATIRAELEEAREALSLPPESRTQRFLSAMRRVRGLVGDVSGIAQSTNDLIDVFQNSP
jgi:hypothetical protein